ncbi:cadherin-related family member 4 isoform X7 [Mustela erminea]|uniref:cadherin-related family member 4 isoform X7 n=1 Tax=Mustela erminea TaxID=36723 RepID=UPI0013876281|nr:cadherin-related family member 4 isoform X7 [Mustela erminea]
MALLRPPLLLLALVVSELHGLPWFINVSESQGPGAILYSFPINCTSYVPTLELLYVQPPTTFFNPPSLNRQQKTYMAMVTLSSSARLDALAVNHYRLQLRLTCGKKVLEAPLSVNVHRDPGHSPCAGQFANPGGEIIQVRETVTPGAQLYTLLLPGLQLQRAQLRINSAQDPPYFPGPFSINGQGWLLAPSQGLKGHAPKVFPLEVLVSFGQNQSCHRMLKVKVLPDPSSQISFLGQAPNVTILEDLAPGSNVVQVRARGLDVRYEILSPVPCPLFSIGREDGVVRTTAPLELASARGVAVTRLQVKAYERRRPWASVDLDVTVNVRSVNRWPPCCLPAMLVTEIPETTPVGTVLKTFTCTDPDSAGSPLDYELQFHSPPGPASLCLRGRALEVPSPAYRPMCWVLQDMKDVNDYAPKCQPPFQELTIYAPLGHSVEVTKVSCWVPQEPQRRAFSYSIVGGNSQSRFSLQGPILVHKSITWGPQWPEQPHTYELLIRVADAGPSIPHLSTTATVIVHLIPWSTSTVTTRTHRSPVPSVMTPLLVTDVEAFWQPEPWFVVVLTVTSALFLLALGWLFNRLFQGLAQMLQSPSKSAQALLLNSIQGTEESIEGFTEAPRTEMPRAPSSVVSLQHFDGRAQDSRTGREYLFNTLTGARRWL